jgi:acyl-CoA synthetase (AMP-forming)/AMP-acid ligase II
MKLLHDLIAASADARPDSVALHAGADRLTYADLAARVRRVAAGLQTLGVARRDRVAIYLPKSFETVEATFGTSAAGAVFVPVNPVLKAGQVAHILRDSGARVLITSRSRAESLAAELDSCPDLRNIVLTDGNVEQRVGQRTPMTWAAMLDAPAVAPPRGIDADVAAILYTSGSTGKPKGVVLSQRNMVAGAQSVAHYLENRPSDRILAVLPFSFDYGFSQLSTAFLTGASVGLM